MFRTHFVQECPVCGRPLEILVEYLGRQVTCNHCGGDLIAFDPARRPDQTSRGEQLLDRADALLDASGRRLGTRDWP